MVRLLTWRLPFMGLWGTAALLLWGCGGSGHAPAPPASLETESTTLRQLQVLETVPVQGRSGPGGKPFQVSRRTGSITQYPCQSCHETSVAQAPRSEVSRRWAHLDIQLQHAEALHCGSCHQYENLGTLRLIDGDAVNFDHSYQVCAQCHSPQARDWAGGAHGKRLGGWRGARVVESCTGCHNPHAPAFPRRMPRMYPQVPRTGTDR